MKLTYNGNDAAESFFAFGPTGGLEIRDAVRGGFGWK
jgi:hypothetical protein